MLAAAAVAALVAAIPLVYLVVRASEAGVEGILAALWRERNAVLALNSLGLALAVAAGCLLLGIPTAWAITRLRMPLPGLWRVLAALPLAIPSYVTAFAWVATWPGVRGFWPLLAVMVLACTPYVTLAVAAALRLADPGVEDVARTLGKSPLSVFLTVTLPQIAPAAAAGALLAALYTLSDFGAVSVMRFQTLTWAIHSAYQGTLDRVLAAVMAVLLVLLALLVVSGERLLRTRATRRQAAIRTREPVLLEHRKTRTAATIVLAAVAALSLGLPILALLRRLIEGTSVGLDFARLAESTGSTLLSSLAGAGLAVGLALPIAVLAARYRSRLVTGLETVTYVGHVVPGIVVGLSLVFFSLAVVPELYQTVIVLAFAYAVLFLPRAIGSARAAIGQVSPALEEVSRTLGRSPARTWFTVTARTAWPGIAAGALLVMVTAMKELPATLMLRPIGTNTLATELWEKTTNAAYGAAAPYAIALVLLASVPAYLLSRPRGAGW